MWMYYIYIGSLQIWEVFFFLLLSVFWSRSLAFRSSCNVLVGGTSISARWMKHELSLILVVFAFPQTCCNQHNLKLWWLRSLSLWLLMSALLHHRLYGVSQPWHHLPYADQKLLSLHMWLKIKPSFTIWSEKIGYLVTFCYFYCCRRCNGNVLCMREQIKLNFSRPTENN